MGRDGKRCNRRDAEDAKEGIDDQGKHFCLSLGESKKS